MITDDAQAKVIGALGIGDADPGEVSSRLKKHENTVCSESVAIKLWSRDVVGERIYDLLEVGVGDVTGFEAFDEVIWLCNH